MAIDERVGQPRLPTSSAHPSRSPGARQGYFPTPALELLDDPTRAIWFEAYARTHLERDLQAPSAITALPGYRRTTRLIKSPKLFWSDVGLALHLSGSPEPTGAHLENLVLHDMLVWRDARTSRAELHHWRTADGREVDLVIEAEGMLLPVEVKSTRRPRVADTAGLRAFRTLHEDHARAGLLLHDGERTEWLTADVLAVPWWRVL